MTKSTPSGQAQPGINAINILLIEDNPGDARLVQEALKDNQDLEVNLLVVSSLSVGLKYIATNQIHIILLDLNLPDSRGIETFREVCKFAINVPVIILSIISNKEIIYQAMLEGAQDYLIKGEIDNEILIRAIRYALWRSHTSLAS